MWYFKMKIHQNDCMFKGTCDTSKWKFTRMIACLRAHVIFQNEKSPEWLHVYGHMWYFKMKIQIYRASNYPFSITKMYNFLYLYLIFFHIIASFGTPQSWGWRVPFRGYNCKAFWIHVSIEFISASSHSLLKALLNNVIHEAGISKSLLNVSWSCLHWILFECLECN